MRTPSATVRGLMLTLSILAAASSHAHSLEGSRTLKSVYAFNELVTRLEVSVANYKMAVVASASASKGAASRGVTIPGNIVIMVFRNDYAVRMLEASVPAGIEAPLRYYVTENTDGTANVTWRTPSATFAIYRNAKIDEMARELDPIFDAIARDAVR